MTTSFWTSASRRYQPSSLWWPSTSSHIFQHCQSSAWSKKMALALEVCRLGYPKSFPVKVYHPVHHQPGKKIQRGVRRWSPNFGPLPKSLSVLASIIRWSSTASGSWNSTSINWILPLSEVRISSSGVRNGPARAILHESLPKPGYTKRRAARTSLISRALLPSTSSSSTSLSPDTAEYTEHIAALSSNKKSDDVKPITFGGLKSQISDVMCIYIYIYY